MRQIAEIAVDGNAKSETPEESANYETGFYIILAIAILLAIGVFLILLVDYNQRTLARNISQPHRMHSARSSLR